MKYIFVFFVSICTGKILFSQDTKLSKPFVFTINGFTVVKQSNDDIFESDGKGDEIYFRVDIFELDEHKNIISRKVFKSAVLGDINRQNDPPRIQAGSLSDKGGLRTGDNYPTDEPWRIKTAAAKTGTSNPAPPMEVWKGTLTKDKNRVIMICSVWEWDSKTTSDMELYFNTDLLTDLKTKLNNDLHEWRGLLPMIHFKGSFDKNTPIGVSDPQPNVSTRPLCYINVVELDYQKALDKANGTGWSSGAYGKGIIESQYDSHDGNKGQYKVFFQVQEQK